MTAPNVEDPLSAPHWTGAGEGRLLVQRCSACCSLRWPPLPSCPECLSDDGAWVEVAPRGEVWSFVTYHRAFAKAYAEQIPYTVLMVALQDGPHVVGRLEPEGPVAVGDAVEAVFVDLTPGHTQVRWRKVEP